MAGVWIHNDLENQGNAQMISTILGSIDGKDSSTSYVMYSRSWSSEEESLINTSVKDIVAQHPNAEGSVPFEGMKALLCGSSNAPNNVEHPEECLEADSKRDSSESDTSKSKSQNNQDLRKSFFCVAFRR
jgi:hypothetical protein